MSFVVLLISVFLIVFLVLAIVLIVALRAPADEYDPDLRTLLPQSTHTSPSWRNRVGRFLVRRPWPYKDLYNPLNRLYWPDEEVNKRAQRRRVRRKSKR